MLAKYLYELTLANGLQIKSLEIITVNGHSGTRDPDLNGDELKLNLTSKINQCT